MRELKSYRPDARNKDLFKQLSYIVLCYLVFKSKFILKLILRNCFGRFTLEFCSLKDKINSLGHKDRKSTRLNSSHTVISYAVFCLKKKTNRHRNST